MAEELSDDLSCHCETESLDLPEKCVQSADGGRIIGGAKKSAFNPLTADESSDNLRAGGKQNAFDPPTAEKSSDALKQMRSIP
jgi:hypothetical protein